MSRKRQVLDNNQKLISFVVRIPETLKRRLEEHSARVGQSQALIITDLVANHIPDGRGVTLPKVPYQEHDADQTDLERWLADHAR